MCLYIIYIYIYIYILYTHKEKKHIHAHMYAYIHTSHTDTYYRYKSTPYMNVQISLRNPQHSQPGRVPTISSDSIPRQTLRDRNGSPVSIMSASEGPCVTVTLRISPMGVREFGACVYQCRVIWWVGVSVCM